MKWLPVIDEYPTVGIVSKMITLPIIVQGIIFGILASVFIGIPVIAWFILTGTQSMPYESFRWYKAIFGAALSIIVSPPIGLLSILDFSRRKKLIR
jgi:integral membrane sensor domain MASE1